MTLVEERAELSPSLQRMLVVLQDTGIRLRSKRESIIMRLIGKAYPAFTQRYFTAIGSTIWLPEDEHLSTVSFGTLFRTLAHCYVHCYDAKHHPIAFFLGYTSPQVFALFSLFGLYYWPMALLALCALPLPSIRLHWELRAYAMNLVLLQKRLDIVPEDRIDRYVDIICSGAYYLYYDRVELKEKLIAYYTYAMTTKHDFVYTQMRAIA